MLPSVEMSIKETADSNLNHGPYPYTHYINSSQKFARIAGRGELPTDETRQSFKFPREVRHQSQANRQTSKLK